jgi:CheY-like chemotaxis protein
MSGLSVLVVDDDPDMRFVLGEVLRWSGHSVREVRHGQDALDLMASGWLPHLILLDIAMPVMDGLTFLRSKQKIRELADVPVVVVSATAEPPIDGVCCVLRKPVDPGDLVSVVNTVTGKSISKSQS